MTTLILIVEPLLIPVITLLARRMAVVAPARRAWRLAKREPTVAFVSNSTAKETREYLLMATGIGQVQALSHLTPFFMSAFPRASPPPRVRLSSQWTPEHLHENLILLGGPSRNAVTKKFFDRLGGHFPVRQAHDPERATGDRIFWPDNPEEGLVGVSEGGRITQDYGLIVRVPSVFNEDRMCLLFSGTRTHGTAAAAQFFAENARRWFFYGRAGFAALVTAQIEEDHVTSVRLARPILRLKAL